MKKQGILATMILGLVLVFAVGSVQAAEYTWKCQSMYAAGQPNFKSFENFCKNVERMSSGRLVIKPMSAGSIVPTFELLDAIQSGVMEAMHTGAVYYSGKEPGLAMITDMIYAWGAPWEAEAWFYYGGGKELLNEVYNKYGITAIGVVQWGFESFPSKFPIQFHGRLQGPQVPLPPGNDLGHAERSSAPESSYCPAVKCTPPWTRVSLTAPIGEPRR